MYLPKLSENYGCPENSRESLSTPMHGYILPKFLMGFCSDLSYEFASKI